VKFNELTQLTLLIESLSTSGFLMTEAVKLAKELQDIFKKFDLKVPDDVPDVQEIKLKDKDLLKVFDGRKEQDLKMGKVLLKLFPDLDQTTLLQIVGEIKAESTDDIEFTVEKDVVKAYTTYCIESCMTKYSAKKQLYFYTTQPDISIVIARKDGKPVGRALLWSKVEGAKNGMFMDRIYPVSDEMIVSKFKKYAQEKGWSHRLSQGAHNTQHIRILSFHVKNEKDLAGKPMPFMDTFRYAQKNKPVLSNSELYFSDKGDGKLLVFTDSVQTNAANNMLFSDTTTEINLDLIRAAEYGDKPQILKLLSLGADVHINDDEPLRKVVRRENKELVEILLKHGADANAKDNEALITSVEYGNSLMTELLLKYGANANIGEALATAANFGDLKILKLFLDYGANPNKKWMSSTPLFYALVSDQLGAVKLLSDHGATTDGLSEDEIKTLENMLAAKV